MESPLISVITVSYNIAGTIGHTIKSVINQKFKNFEYIIVNGGSRDGTIEVIEQYADKITYWISAPDNGIYDAMNKGLTYAKGNFIYFIGGDDVFMDENVLAKVSRYLINKREIYYGNVFFKNRKITYDGKFNAIKLVTRNISHQSIFYPIGIFKEFQFNTKYNIFADYELNLKLYNHKVYYFKYIAITVALFNDEGTSGLNTIDSNFEVDRLKIIKNNFSYPIYLYRVFRYKAAALFS